MTRYLRGFRLSRSSDFQGSFGPFGNSAFSPFGNSAFSETPVCIRGDNLALMTAGRVGGGRGGEANNVLCLAFLASGLFQDILSMSPWLSVALASVLVLRVARWPLPSALRRFVHQYMYRQSKGPVFSCRVLAALGKQLSSDAGLASAAAVCKHYREWTLVPQL